MSAKTFVKVCWFVVLGLAILVLFVNLGSNSYFLQSDEQLNIRVSPFKRIRTIQMVEIDDESPVEYRFVNSREGFKIYSYTDHGTAYRSEKAFGGVQEVNFRAPYGYVFGVDNSITKTGLGIRSSYPMGVQVVPDGLDLMIYFLGILWLGLLSGRIVFSL